MKGIDAGCGLIGGGHAGIQIRSLRPHSAQCAALIAPYDALVGQNIKLRWLYRTDTAQLGEGWFIDDIAISHAQVPGMCSAAGTFGDGFE